VSDDDRSEQDRRAEVAALFASLHDAPEGSDERKRLRDALVEAHIPLVKYLARRFNGRNVPLEDLVQVGMVGLIKAIDRFDASLGYEFVTYAAPTVLGEIKRHIRDTGWLLRVPRAAQELQAAVSQARAVLSQELKRSPTVAELAEHIGASAEQVMETLDVARSYSGVPIDALTDPDAPSSAEQLLAETDESFERVELRQTLQPALEVLTDQERQVVSLRFVAGKTQTEIAELVGVSQMQVSRLLSRSLARMREVLEG